MKNHLSLLIALALLLPVSCVRQEQRGWWDDSSVGELTFSGVVTDTFGNVLEDVDICFRGTNMERELRHVAFSDWDGTYRIENVPSNARYITFSLPGYATVAITIDPKRFAQGGEIELSPVLEFSNAVIRGRVLSAVDGQPLSGVRVDCGLAVATSDADGFYEIASLPLKDYTLTYTVADGSTYSREVAMGDFTDSRVELSDLRLGGGDDLYHPG